MNTIVSFWGGLLVAAVILSGCSFPSSSSRPSDNQITKKYNVTPFQEIDNKAPVHIIFTQGNTFQVEVEGPDNYIENLQVQIKDSTVLIATKQKNDFKFRKDYVTFHITSPTLKTVNQRGVGNITLCDTVRVNDISLICSGVGSIRTDALFAQELEVYQLGVGSMDLKGEAQQGKFRLEGVGSLEARNMKMSDLVVEQSGVGSISCYASETISIASSGVGSVNYYGHPHVKSLSKKGIGSVNCK